MLVKGPAAAPYPSLMVECLLKFNDISGMYSSKTLNEIKSDLLANY